MISARPYGPHPPDPTRGIQFIESQQTIAAETVNDPLKKQQRFKTIIMTALLPTLPDVHVVSFPPDASQ
jgi:hypothetical protein